MHLRDATPGDIPAILEIFNEAVRETTAAWTNQQDTLEARLAWLESCQEKGLSVLVAEGEGGDVVGFASFGTFRAREGYRLTAEHSVYVASDARRLGAGLALLEGIAQRAEKAGMHLLVGTVDGDNAASIALHQKAGFAISVRLPQAGTKFGRWLDLVLMTRVLNPGMAAPDK
ncbi:N-acetyltransferase [Rhodobacterales bacterium]|nr:N-acetyltransferase [Rhodobacterales bacterium]